jgi:hypothetical protein
LVINVFTRELHLDRPMFRTPLSLANYKRRFSRQRRMERIENPALSILKNAHRDKNCGRDGMILISLSAKIESNDVTTKIVAGENRQKLLFKPISCRIASNFTTEKRQKSWQMT